ncbi:large ribosomal subunit protein bL32, partial [Methylobacterium oryzisoli]|uniref:large ribosomal subunit protein bL32 n=1 Tax=Methylobacterium oryzisoli TaxID=3385502 RepID=UPI00397AF198
MLRAVPDRVAIGHCSKFLICRIFCDEPASTSSENALADRGRVRTSGWGLASAVRARYKPRSNRIPGCAAAPPGAAPRPFCCKRRRVMAVPKRKTSPSRRGMRRSA